MYINLFFPFLYFCNIAWVQSVKANSQKDNTITIIPSHIPNAEKNLKKQHVIEQKANAQVIDTYISVKTKIQYDQEDETDEERQERYHNENMDLQKKHHTEQVLIQKENRDMQEQHFFQ